MIRVMTCCTRFAHTNPLFLNLKLLKLPDIIQFQTCVFVYKALNIFSVNCGFQYTAQNIPTRRADTIRIPLCRTSFAQRDITYRGTSAWNLLPHDIKESNSVNIFKFRLKNRLIESYK